LDRSLGGPQSQSGIRGLEKNALPLLGFEPGSPNPDTVLTELPWLLKMRCSIIVLIISLNFEFRNLFILNI
jgi:hypothetical protein